jgi:ribosomal protein S18 acetylase RimI-like enzyme
MNNPHGIVRIAPLDSSAELENLLYVIQESFLTVAHDFDLTPENAPTNPAFLTMERLRESIENRLEFLVARFGETIVGCVGIQPGKTEDEYYIERLAVLPAYRHNGIGKRLLDAAAREIAKRGATRIGIGIIDENTVLKNWYRSNGFTETGTKKFDHLPFTVCFMKKEL